MATFTEAGLVEMRLVKVVALAIADGDPSHVVVLEAVSQDQVLPIEIGPAEGFNLAAALTGVQLARPMARSSRLAWSAPSAAGSGRCASTG
jgi:hypothetical protein